MKTKFASILMLLSAIPVAVAANDSDGDGVADAVELADGTNPNNDMDWKPFSKDMLLCYPFEGNADDISGNGGNGALYNAPGFVPGVRGQAVAFDGVDDHFARTPVPITSNPFTYSIWLKLPTNHPLGTWMTVFQQGQSWEYSPILNARAQDASHFELSGYTWTGGYSGISSSPVSCADPYAWHHIVWTSAPTGDRKLYIDGDVVASTTGQAFGQQNSYLRLGGNIAEDQYNSYHADEFRIYDRALSDTEVAAMFANQSPVQIGISGFTPASGSAGSSVTITGTNFTDTTAVRFGGVDALSFTVNSANQITARVPLGGITGPITVITTAGSADSSGNFTVTLSSDTTLSSLTLSAGTLSPAFDSWTLSYTASVPHNVTSVTVTPTTTALGATVQVNGIPVTSGSASQDIPLAPGDNHIVIWATAEDQSASTPYTIEVNRNATLDATFAAIDSIPVTAAAYSATGSNVNLSLGFTPPVGTSLTLVKNSGLGYISGQFSNLAHGQTVQLAFDGVTHRFVANYYGGTGNDLVLECSGRQLVVWGDNQTTPTILNQTGLLSGKTVLSVASGENHNLALCSDGILAAWGSNNRGQLGDGSGTYRATPVVVDQSGILAGKTIVAIAGGCNHSLALCSDGTLAAWGGNFGGQLGDGTTTDSNVPVAVNRDGVLNGKTIIAIAAGGFHNLVLCSDGTIATWGYNEYGQVGDFTPFTRTTPVAVYSLGILANKTVVAIAAGREHSLVLCSDGTLVAWGANYDGRLGDGSTTNSAIPVAVNQTGALTGKTISRVACGDYHNLVLCSDGALASWGSNGWGQLGNGSTTNSNVPVAINQTGVLAGRTPATIRCGTNHSLTLCSDGSLAAWGANYGGQLGDGTANPSNVPGAVPDTGLIPGSRIVGISAGSARSLGLAAHAPLSSLASLSLSDAVLSPAFSPGTTDYTASVPNATCSVTVTPTPTDTMATVEVDGGAVAPGSASWNVPLAGGINTIAVLVTAVDGSTNTTYTLLVTRGSTLDASFAATDTAPVTAATYTATGCSVNLSLGFAPPVGTSLMVVMNTGRDFISGQFSNLAHGQTVELAFGGTTYRFVANYYGGSGNDLVLEWPCRQAVGWGRNSYGQLGNGTNPDSNVPVAVNQTGVLAGKTIVAVSGGQYMHSFALCSDGTLAAWGYNYYGQFGNGTNTDSKVPVAVNQTGVLAGKTIIAVSCGANHSLALCSDGIVAAWGHNGYGQLGNGTTTNSNVPVGVNQTGVLAGKTVVAVAGGSYHSLVLCSDGTLAAWGANTNSTIPVAINQTGVLAGKSVIAVSCSGHSLALCSDGTLAAWGDNTYGQLGNATNTSSNVPVAVNKTGVLAGKAIIAVSCGGAHSLALCADGSLAAWGHNSAGQLGNGTTTNSNVPVGVNQTGVLAGRTVAAVSGGSSHSLILCSDGTPAAWGYNQYGQLGNGTTTHSDVPVVVELTGTLAIAGGSYHNLALAAYAPSSALASLSSSTGTLSPAFSTETLSYTASVPTSTTSITVTPTASTPGCTITVNGQPVMSGAASQAIALTQSPTVIEILVTAADNSTRSYTLSVVSGMEAWKVEKFTTDELADPEISGDQATPAHDGISNLMKYALVLEPKVCGSADLPYPDKEDGYLTLTYRHSKQAGDITFTVEAGDSLAVDDWQPETTELSRTDEGDHWLVTVRDNIAISDSPCRFMRLKVSR